MKIRKFKGIKVADIKTTNAGWGDIHQRCVLEDFSHPEPLLNNAIVTSFRLLFGCGMVS